MTRSSRPTLLNVNNYHYRRGGAEVVSLDQTRLFTDRGWDVVPFAMHHPDNEPSEWDEYWVDEIELGSDYSLPQKIVRSGRVVYSRQAKKRLGALLDARRPDVAHLHNVYHHISPAILPVLAEREIPTVLTTHDLKLACPAYKMLTHDGICERCKGGNLTNAVRHRCIKGSTVLSTVVFIESSLHRALGSFDHVDRFISPSRFYIDTFVDWGFDRERFTHVPNFVDASRFEPSADFGTYVVYFGRLAEEKGLHTLVRASAASGVAVEIVGTGPEEASLRALAAELDAPVTFAGYRSGTDLHDRIRASRAIVLPSEWYENGPMSALEAFALGRPLVGARIGGITEMVRDDTGWTFTSGDADDLARVLTTVADTDDATLRAMGQACRRWVETDFSSERHVERLLDVYRAVGADLPN